MACAELRFEELTQECLNQLTEICALEIHGGSGNADSLYNWIEGKKLVGFMIADCYLKKCQEDGKCLPLPSFCDEYLDQVTIEDVKRLKAYFLWESNGRSMSDPSSHLSDYYAACRDLMLFCDFESATSDCTYVSEILFRIDRRKCPDRRVSARSVASDRRCNICDRRQSQDPRYQSVLGRRKA